MFKKGFITVDGITCTYWMKHFDDPSQFGINGGRISKLCIKVDGIERVGYDRGWYNRPDASREGRAAADALDRIVTEYN